MSLSGLTEGDLQFLKLVIFESGFKPDFEKIAILAGYKTRGGACQRWTRLLKKLGPKAETSSTATTITPDKKNTTTKSSDSGAFLSSKGFQIDDGVGKRYSAKSEKPNAGTFRSCEGDVDDDDDDDVDVNASGAHDADASHISISEDKKLDPATVFALHGIPSSMIQTPTTSLEPSGLSAILGNIAPKSKTSFMKPKAKALIKATKPKTAIVPKVKSAPKAESKPKTRKRKAQSYVWIPDENNPGAVDVEDDMANFLAPAAPKKRKINKPAGVKKGKSSPHFWVPEEKDEESDVEIDARARPKAVGGAKVAQQVSWKTKSFWPPIANMGKEKVKVDESESEYDSSENGDDGAVEAEEEESVTVQATSYAGENDDATSTTVSGSAFADEVVDVTGIDGESNALASASATVPRSSTFELEDVDGIHGVDGLGMEGNGVRRDSATATADGSIDGYGEKIDQCQDQDEQTEPTKNSAKWQGGMDMAGSITIESEKDCSEDDEMV